MEFQLHFQDDDLVITEDMPITGKSAYSCKEHPNIWDTSLKGLEISHFIPKHGKKSSGQLPQPS
jgi:hypothetical protein